VSYSASRDGFSPAFRVHGQLFLPHHETLMNVNTGTIDGLLCIVAGFPSSGFLTGPG